jgi:hypothetical protein
MDKELEEILKNDEILVIIVEEITEMEEENVYVPV